MSEPTKPASKLKREAAIAANVAKGLPPAAGVGRPKGVPNKATTNAREAIARLVDANLSNVQGWLERIAVDDPKGATQCLMDLCEYHVPKLARTEHVGDKGAPIVIQITPLEAQL